MKEVLFNAKDNKKIVCSLWDDVSEPKGIIQIIHGMNEHIQRYDRFAKFLNKNGYIVFGDDHRAHGRTATVPEKIGKPDGEKDLFAATLSDEIEISKYLKNKYKLPVFVFAHSYGSFIGQALLEKKLDIHGLCLCGSAKFSKTFMIFAKFFAFVCSKLFGADANAYLIELFSPIRDINNLSRDIQQVRKYAKDRFVRKHFSYGFYYSLFSNQLKLSGKINVKAPVLIIAGSNDAVGGNARLILRLYKTYIDNGYTDVYLRLYPEAKHELLNELNYAEVQNDVLDFFDLL